MHGKLTDRNWLMAGGCYGGIGHFFVSNILDGAPIDTSDAEPLDGIGHFFGSNRPCRVSRFWRLAVDSAFTHFLLVALQAQMADRLE